MSKIRIKLKKWYKQNLKIILIISGLVIAFNYIVAYMGAFKEIENILYIILTVVFGTPILSRAISALKYRVVGIELLVSIAVLGALLIEEYKEAGMVTFLFQLGSYLEMRTLEKTRKSLKALTEMAPTTALLIKDGIQIEVDVEEVEIEDKLIVKTGAKIAVDGEIIRGDGYFNEASITGEANLAHKSIGDMIYAGTILESGMVEMSACSVGEDTTFAKIIHLVEEAQDTKSPVEKFIDSFAKWYTPFVALFAFIIWFISKDTSLAITILVLACPGALVIGAPIASVAGIGKGAKEGVLLKGGDSIDAYAKSDIMIFDKTGTLTKGKPGISDVCYFVDDTKKVDTVSALAESVSDHPIAHAILTYAKMDRVTREDILLISNIKGMGIHVVVNGIDVHVGNEKLMRKANIQLSNKQLETLDIYQTKGVTTVLVALDYEVAAIYAIADMIKKDAKDTLYQLKKMGIKKTVMLSGDHQQSAQYVGSELGMDEVYGGLLPEDKLIFVKDMQQKGYRVTFVGDGINDSPALVSADIGIAMGSGTDVAIETSNIVLVKSDLTSLVKSFQLAKDVVHITHQNIAIAIGTVLFLLIGLFSGFIHMASGMFVHELSILVVIINAMRLLRNKKRRKENEEK